MHVIFPSFSRAPVLLSNVKSLCEYAIKYQIKAKNVHPQNVAMKYAGKTNRHGISIFLFCFVLERSMQISIDTMVLTGLRLQNEKINTYNCCENIWNVSLWFLRYFFKMNFFITEFINHTSYVVQMYWISLAMHFNVHANFTIFI